MNKYSALLQKAGSEMRVFARTEPARGLAPDWLERFASRLELAGTLDEAQIDDEIATLAHMLIDSGPLSADSAPSFHTVLDAYQRARKKGKGSR